MLEKGLRVRRFFEFEAASIYEKVKIIETLLPSERGAGASHKGEEGRYLEALVRDFLNRHLPDGIKAVSGFIVLPATKTGSYNLARVDRTMDRHSRQLDIIVFDFANYPVYERSEEFCIVPPEGVVGILSIKKTLRARDVKNELTSLREASQICNDAFKLSDEIVRGPFVGLFAFSAERRGRAATAASLFRHISDDIEGLPFDLMINEISVFGQYLIFKFRSADSPPGKARYVDVSCTDQRHISLQRMLNSILSVYYDPTRRARSQRPGFVSFNRGTFGEAPVLGDVGVQSKPPAARRLGIARPA
jgi:hypothetical protein